MEEEKDITIYNIERFEVPKLGVYILFDKNKIVYIGKSVDIFRRLRDHVKDKYFDNYGFIKCENKAEMNKLEKVLIGKFKPHLNIHYKSIEIKSNIKLHLESIKKLNELADYFCIETY